MNAATFESSHGVFHSIFADPCTQLKYPEFQKAVSKNVNAIKSEFRHLNASQREVLNRIVMWNSMMSEMRNPNIQRLLSESSQGILRELQWFGSTVFFLRGPPGTEKSRVISALMYLLFKTRNMRDEIYKLEELCEIRKVLIFSESNNSIDATMNSIIHANIFKYSGDIYPVVRVGVNSKDAEVRQLRIENILDAEERI